MSDPAHPADQRTNPENGSLSTTSQQTQEPDEHNNDELTVVEAEVEPESSSSAAVSHVMGSSTADTADQPTLPFLEAAGEFTSDDSVQKEDDDTVVEDTLQKAKQPTEQAFVNDQSGILSTASVNDVKQAEPELPASPPPPALPRKDDARVEKPLASRENVVLPMLSQEHQFDLPDAVQGSSESTGLEIQTIMDQFQSGSAELDEVQIMSPRLERQQSVLMLPPRTSSLEHRDVPVSSQSPESSNLTERDVFAASEASPSTGRQDDTESIVSAKAGSIFQPPPPAPDPEPALPFDFHRFLEQLRHRTADPVARFLRSFLTEFGKKQWMVHEQVKIISDFLEFIGKKMGQCDVWRTVSDAEFDNAREGIEKLVMNRLYSQTFSPALPPPSGAPRKGIRDARSHADTASPVGPGRRGQHQEDVERDEVIAQKMRIYGWIREEHLEIKIIGDKGRKFLSLAQQELLKINTYRAPRDKVICVLNCCKVIFGFLKNSKSDQSADAFIPLLIYTVLRAQPEHLVSNVQYIWRFRNQDKLGGEAGYYMSSLMGVITFIENLDRTTLHISDQEFERNVEQAVSAIAQENKSEEYEQKTHASGTASPMTLLGEKSTPSQPEVTSRNLLEAERASPRRKLSQRTHIPTSQTEEDNAAVGGLLRSIQRPLHTIGRIFSDDSTPPQTPPPPSAAHKLRPPVTPVPSATPRGLSPDPNMHRRPSAERSPSRSNMQAEEAAARQASAETAEAQRVSAREHAAVLETLQNMFPSLDKDVIQDVVRSQEGNVGRAVDACLALSG